MCVLACKNVVLMAMRYWPLTSHHPAVLQSCMDHHSQASYTASKEQALLLDTSAQAEGHFDLHGIPHNHGRPVDSNTETMCLVDNLGSIKWVRPCGKP